MLAVALLAPPGRSSCRSSARYARYKWEFLSQFLDLKGSAPSLSIGYVQFCIPPLGRLLPCGQKLRAKSDSLRVSGRSAEFKRSNRQPLLGILKFWVAWTIFVPEMPRNRTIRAHGMITVLTVGS